MASLPEEVELKLCVRADCLNQLRANPAFESLIRGEVSEQELLSTYYDFPDLRLYRYGLNLRVRQVGSHRVQTLKSTAENGAAYLQRMEIERRVEGEAPDLRFFAGTALSPLITAGDAVALQPVFEASVKRSSLRLACTEAEIELSLDVGEIKSPVASAPVCEIELELKRGNPDALFDVARTISGIVPAELSLESKADVGYGLVERRSKKMRTADAVTLRPDLSTGDAFKLIARSCLRHLVANYRMVESRESEAIHQTRVALRRLRVALSVFSRVVLDDRLQRMREELKRFAQQLGPARDLDVLTDDVLRPFRARHPKDKGAASLVRSFNRQRAKAHAAAVATVASPEFHAFIIECAAWIETGAWWNDADAGRPLLRQRPVAVHAAVQIGKRRKRCRKFGTNLATLSDEDRHRVRISVKKLRYSIEFFESLYASGAKQKHMKKLLRACQKVQDSLGALNDLAVRREMFGKLLATKNAGALERAFSAGMVLGEQEHEVAAVKKKAARAWNPSTRQKRSGRFPRLSL